MLARHSAYRPDTDLLVREFLLVKATECSPATLRWHTNEITWCRRWCAEQSPPIDLLYAAESDLRRYFLIDLRAHRKLVSVETAYRSIRHFFNWVLEEMEDEPDFPIVKNPCAKIHIPREVKVMPIYTKEEVQAILKACKQGIHERRDTLIVMLFLETGMRAGELINLTLDAFDLKADQPTVLVHGKGSKERILPISSHVMKALRRYVARYNPDPDEPLFFAKGGEPLNYDALNHLMDRLQAVSGVSRVHPHKFRHTFATLAAKNGVQASLIQALLGHKSISTSVHYVNAQNAIKGARNLSIMEIMKEGK